MGISRKQLSENFVPVHFDPAELAVALNEKLAEVDICFLMGSAMNGTVRAFSDLDLAFYLTARPSYGFYSRAMEVVRGVVPDVRCDIGILNSAEPVYRFEALKGRLLFARDQERYGAFFREPAANMRARCSTMKNNGVIVGPVTAQYKEIWVYIAQ